MSKGYTISYFLNTFRNTSNSRFNKEAVASIVSPAKGAGSVKFQALNTYLNGYLHAVVEGQTKFGFNKLGKTPRARLLNALRLRKKLGSFPA